MEQDISDQQFEPEIVMLYCQYSVIKDLDPQEVEKQAQGVKASLLQLPCSSKIEASHLLKILEKGADGVQVLGCNPDVCQTLVGSVRAEKRIQHAQALLEQAGLSGERLALERSAGMGVIQLIGLAERMASKVKPLGPNPMKGESQR